MPELPMCERTRRLLHESCIGGRITAIEMPLPLDTKVIQNPERMSERLIGATVNETGRHGKWIWLELSNAMTVFLHLGMTGFIQTTFTDPHAKVVQYPSSKVKHEVSDVSTWPPRFTKLHFTVKRSTPPSCSGAVEENPEPCSIQIAFSDPRRFGKIMVLSDQEIPTQSPLNGLAPDPLLRLPAVDYFHTALIDPPATRCIKAILLDQRALVAGVGNWVADDVLLHARIHPLTRGCDLTPAEIVKLREGIDVVVRTAVDANADGSLFPKHWLFHYRWDSQQKSLDVPEIGRVLFIQAAGRTTAVVPDLQKKCASGRRGGEVAAVEELDASSAVEQGPTPVKNKRRRKSAS